MSVHETGKMGAAAAVAADDGEESVAAYLRRHPDFLARNPDVVAALRVPHECGAAVSLIEFQVETLRRQGDDLRRRLADLVDNARSNEEVSRRLHRLVLALVESPALDEMFTTLYQGLEEGFGADMLCLRLFAMPRQPEDRGLAELVAPEHPAKAWFTDLFEGRQPVCGPATGEEYEWLFGARAATLGSAALLPLGLGARDGVLAIGSSNPSRFQPAMGTLYLRQLADVLGRLLVRQVC